jgi:nickel-dependent lactate racemase
VVSCCSSGLGPEVFRSLHASSRSPGEVLEMIRDSHYVGVGWQNQVLARAQMYHSIYLLSNLEDSEVSQMMVTPIHSIDEGLEKAFNALGKNATIAVIPEGPLILPGVKQAAG